MSEQDTQEQATPADEEKNAFTVVTSDAPKPPAAEPEPKEGENKAKEGDDTKASESKKTEADNKAEKKAPEESKTAEQKADGDDTKSGDEAKRDGKEKADIPVGTQRALNRLKKQRQDLRGENRQLKELLAQRENGSDENYGVVPGDYATDEEFQTAVSQAKQKKENEDQQRRINEALKEAGDSIFEEVSDDIKNKIMSDKDLDFTTETVIAIGNCEAPGTVAAYLAENPERLSEIAQMTPKRRELALVKLEIKLEAEGGEAQAQPETPPPPPNKETKAPEPIQPESGGGTPPKKVSEMSFAEFERMRNEQEQKKSNTW
jgi:hypothetical protein